MKVFLFDLDGTLLNSLEDIALACNTVLRRHGLPGAPLAGLSTNGGAGF